MPHMFGKPAEDGIGSETFEERMREVLGVNELVAMRTKLVAHEHKALTD